MPRFYDPERGSVEIDGIAIRAVTVESLRDAIGIVQQDVYLFGGTIRDNLSVSYTHLDAIVVYEHASAANDEVEEAAKARDLSIAQRKKYGDTVVDVLLSLIYI